MAAGACFVVADAVGLAKPEVVYMLGVDDELTLFVAEDAVALEPLYQSFEEDVAAGAGAAH